MTLWTKFKNWKCRNAAIAFVIVGSICFIYFLILQLPFVCKRLPHQCDILNRRIYDGGATCCSMWPLSHFIMHFFLGFFFPDCWLFIFITGVVWEVIEFLIGYIGVKVFGKAGAVKNDGDLQYTDRYWAANIYDIFFNVTGLAIGYSLSKAFCKECKTCKNEDKTK